jgi:hypothetical protein
MLLIALQRSESSDSIDYIIDTLDENYQLLTKLERIKTKEEEIQVVPKQEKRKLYLMLKQIDPNVFPEPSEDLLFNVLLSFYK